MLRLFAAIDLPDDVTGRLESLQRGLPGRRVPPENMHLTLAFFGEVSEPVAADLHSALGAISAPEFDLWLDGVDAFGGRAPRNIHAKVRPEPALTHLRDKVAQAGRGAEAPPDEKRFAPHVTLSRLKPGDVSSEKVARALAGRAAFFAGPVEIRCFKLFRSDLGRHGPTYVELAEYSLRQSD